MLIVTETPRLTIRTWQEQDLRAYGEIVGRENLPERFSDGVPASKPETELWRYQLELDQRGWSRWAVVHKRIATAGGLLRPFPIMATRSN